MININHHHRLSSLARSEHAKGALGNAAVSDARERIRIGRLSQALCAFSGLP
jgi:hypothetical protein